MTTDLIIAGRKIRLQSDDDVILRPDERFAAFIATDAKEPELIIDVKPGDGNVPSDAVKVFDAPLLDETPAGPKQSGEPFWEVATDGGVIFVKVSLKDPGRYPLLVIPRGEMKWQLYTGKEGPVADPLPYPVDGLVLYFLTSFTGNIMLHGSGVVSAGRGWIFTGSSGSGKTTMAKIFDSSGDRVIHDDRLVLAREGRGWVMHSTPVYRNDEPRCAAVDRLWIISHGRSNTSTPLSGAEAAGLIMANCIQQNWDREATASLMSSVDDLVSSVRISRLAFLPDSHVRDYLIAHESAPAASAAYAASSLLSEGKEVVITAGGYSMWPAIRPGDRIIIIPRDNEKPLKNGMIVALRRDGGFVVHRVNGKREGRLSTFIRTQGDASMTPDQWVTENEVAGVVKEIIRNGKTLKVSKRRVPYLAGSLATFIVRIWRSALNSRTR